MRRFGIAFCLMLLVSFGGAASASGDVSDYGIKSLSTSATSYQAGDHPNLTIAFDLVKEPNGQLPSTTKEISFDLPPGLLADPSSVLSCSAAQLMSTNVEDEANQGGCPQDSQIGLTEATLRRNGSVVVLLEPIYNMEAPGGDVVARFGFIGNVYPIVIDARLRSDGDYGATVSVQGASSFLPLFSANTTTWGVPADKVHDTERITPWESVHCGGAPCTAPGGARRPSGLSPAPFMINPTRCGVARELTMTATSYGLPDQSVSKTVPMTPISGCGQLNFKPTLSLTPSNREAGSVAGLDADLTLPQNETVNGLATSAMRYAKVSLPKGITIASGAGDGLEACSAEQVGLGTANTSACPNAAKIASVEIDSPALVRPLEGAVYQRTPVKGNLFGVWLVTDELGVHLKLPGEVHADPVSGQLSTVFEGTPQTEGLPQAPVRKFELHFKGGARGVLATPRGCGTYEADYEFAPWSGGPSVQGKAPMTFDSNCDAGGFDPKISAGTTNPVAGAFAPFVTQITRESGDQNLAGVDVTLPPGVLAKVAGVPLCEGTQAVTGDCPASSRVASASVAAGPGPAPLWLPQAGKDPIVAFLSGPYKSGPYSLVINAPAQAGPFDLGTVVTRAAIDIDPNTAHATVASDPLPQILEGVPISYRAIHVDVNRPNFTLNPTSCKQKQVQAKLTSDAGAIARPTSPFQVGDCASLGFKPQLSLRLLGKKTNRGAHPRFRATLRPRPGDANIAYIQAALPHSEFLDQAHIRTICTRVQFAANNCPPGSIYGRAQAVTPLLDEPVSGSVYLRSSSHPLPDMVIAFRGKVDFNLVGRIDSINGGIRSTFESIPDVPVTRATLTMQGGKKGLLVNSRDICREPGRATVKIRAQNGKRADSRPLLRSDCK